MRKLLLPFAALIAIGIGLATAQNITKSVQMSQDPTGVIGVDTNNNIYFPAKVVTTGRTPTLGGGLASSTVSGSSLAGIITAAGAASSAGSLTFATAYTTAPYCIVQATNPGTSPVAYNVVATGINITTWTGALTAFYTCVGS